MNQEKYSTSNKREKCIITDSDDLEFLYSHKEQPGFIGCTTQDFDLDVFADMDWYIGRKSGAIQLKNLLPLDVVYFNNHGSGKIGKVWDKHHTAFCNFLKKFNPKSILEIGGSSGILNSKYNSNIPWTIVEINPDPISNCTAKFIRSVFDERFKYDGEHDVIVHSHLFEHVYNPIKFLKKISSMLSDGEKMIFSIPNMDVMLDKKYSNCLNFEHTFFLIEPYVDYLLSINGFEIIEKEYFMEDHSIFYSTYKSISTTVKNIDNNLYNINKKKYFNYINYYRDLVSNINLEIKNKSNVYLFGAHIFSQNLLSFGLNYSNIEFILDNDVDKQHKRLYGSKLFVRSPIILKNVKNPIVILNAGVYKDEIKSDILNINSSTVFV
jgi:2-polyprenyl-3-methyl-5-hydroxy-6-metoxy-1,4-benzoquinol methylase